MMESIKKRISSKNWVFWGKVSLVLFVSISWVLIFVDFNLLFNNKYQSLWIHSPSTVEEGEEFKFTIEAWDEFERLAGSFEGEIEFELVSYNVTETGYKEIQSPVWSLKSDDNTFSSNFVWAGIFPAYQFKGADNGQKEFSMQISTPGIHYIQATDKETGDVFLSNPIVVHNKGSNYNHLYWGDIHAHSTQSDGSGTFRDNYKFARDVAKLDFAALTDHSEMFPHLDKKHF